MSSRFGGRLAKKLSRDFLEFGDETTNNPDSFVGKLKELSNCFRVKTNEIIGREKVIEEIEGILSSHKFIYIYGAPGVGKTVCIMKILNQLKNSKSVTEYFYLNCMQSTTFSHFLNELTNKLDEIDSSSSSTSSSNHKNFKEIIGTPLKEVTTPQSNRRITRSITMKKQSTTTTKAIQSAKKETASKLYSNIRRVKTIKQKTIQQITQPTSSHHQSTQLSLNEKFQKVISTIMYICEMKTLYIVLDEMDSLHRDIKKLSLLIQQLQSTNVKFVGIGNSVGFILKYIDDVTKIGQIVIPPYTSQEIHEVIIEKIRKINHIIIDGRSGQLIDDKCIKFASKKVAATTGDMRRALNIFKNVIDLIRASNRKKTIDMKLFAQYFNNVLQRNELDVVKMTDENHPEDERISLQHKVILVMIVIIMKKKNISGEIPLEEISKCYTEIYSLMNIENRLQMGTLMQLCDHLSDKGLISFKRSLDLIDSLVTLRVDINRLDDILREQPVTGSMLDKALYL
ncbi:hypothetical protein SNEBB_008777 [Seison nebaliae]|nr:hypothetical protein SNEBB_008777 [Seison nebaliae]